MSDSKIDFHKLIEQSPYTSYVARHDPLNGLSFLYLSPQIGKVLGISTDEFLSNPEKFKQQIHPEDRERILTELQAAHTSGKHFTLEFRMLTHDGKVVWLWDDGTSTPDMTGNIFAIQGILRDTRPGQTDRRLAYTAHHDTLTGLPNRVLFRSRMERAMSRAKRNDSMMALMSLDLDHFKEINDACGHIYGDKVLQGAAQRLQKQLRDVDTIARVGGDEFAIILDSIGHADQIAMVSRRILDAMALPILMEGKEIYVPVSIGISVYPLDTDDIDILHKNANIALHHAKQEGRNNYQLYSSEMNSGADERISMESHLRRALERNEFTLHYQPQINVITGKIIGAEALLRWRSAELGMISPIIFIPLAEKTGLIAPIGEWVLQIACAQNKAWQHAGYAPMVIAVNLSQRQFRHNDLIANIASALEGGVGLDANYLELEITESMVMNRIEQTISTLEKINLMGVQLSIDDFGTGYSSLSHIKRFPLQKLKIDQSFVRDIHLNKNSEAIVQAVISLGHAMGLKVIAEGVETKQQLEFLRDHGCDEIQGYYFSKPLPAEEFEQLLIGGRGIVH